MFYLSLIYILCLSLLYILSFVWCSVYLLFHIVFVIWFRDCFSLVTSIICHRYTCMCFTLIVCTVCHWFHVLFVIGIMYGLSLVSRSVCHWLHVVCVSLASCGVCYWFVLLVCHWFHVVCEIDLCFDGLSFFSGSVCHWLHMVYVFGFKGSLSLVWCIVLMLVFRSLRRYICNYKHSWTTLYTEKSTCYTWSWFLHLHESGPMQNQSLEMNVSENHSFKA